MATICDVMVDQNPYDLLIGTVCNHIVQQALLLHVESSFFCGTSTVTPRFKNWDSYSDSDCSP